MDAVRRDLLPTLRLAWPVIVAELGWMFMGVVDTVMVGRIAPEAIGAVGLGSILYFSAAIFGMGLLLGLAVSLVLVHVVNPQSFHWTMDLLLPWGRLGLLCAAVVLAGTITAWASARGAAGRQMVLAVKEDW